MDFETYKHNEECINNIFKAKEQYKKKEITKKQVQDIIYNNLVVFK